MPLEERSIACLKQDQDTYCMKKDTITNGIISEFACPVNFDNCPRNMEDVRIKLLQFDILYYRDHLIFHLIDRCTRWHAGSNIPNKEEQTLLDAIADTWTDIFGHMTYHYTDCESGLTNDSAKAKLKSLGTEQGINMPITSRGMVPYSESRCTS